MRLAEDIADVLTVAFGHGVLSEMTPRGWLRLVRSYLRGRRDAFTTLATAAANDPHGVAVVDDERTWTKRQLHEASIRLAAWLHTYGHTDRVGVVLENSGRWFVAMAALLELGATPLPMSPKLPPAERDRRLTRAGASFALTEDFDWSVLENGAPRRTGLLRNRWGKGEVMLHTSGTTGRSKGARIRTSGARMGTPFRYLQAFDLRHGDRLYTPCPLYHGAPVLLTGLSLICGAEIVVSRKFNAQALRECTHAFLVPTLMQRLLESEVDLPHMRALISGGALLRAETKRKLLYRFGPVLYDFYGATELGVVTVASPADLRHKPYGVGKPIRGVEVRLGPDGELFARSDMLTPYEGVEPTSRFPGWGSAGDIARIETDGTVVIVDRKKDVVVSGGVNLFPAEVEERLEEHSDVREAACAGRPDETFGEALHAWYVGGVEPDDLRAWCRERMAPYEIPRRVTRVDAIPRSPEGKVLRRQLR